jgi:hypothetical protein
MEDADSLPSTLGPSFDTGEYVRSTKVSNEKVIVLTTVDLTLSLASEV